MVVRKTDPVGIDLIIDMIQTKIDEITFKAGSTWNNYHRAYKNPVKTRDRNGLVPELFVNGIDYRDVLMDDTIDLTTFFIVSDRRPVNNGIITTEISLIIQASKLDNLIDSPHRADEEINSMFIGKLNKSISKIKLTGIEHGIDNVYREFVRTKIKLNDMNQRHVARFNMEVTYVDSCCDC